MSLSEKDFRISNWELWQAIRDAPLPGAESRKSWSGHSRTETFQERLSSKYDLTEESARRLVEEYRRFLYLKATEGGTITPSERVDQAWHLHIETPGGEWTRFCKEVLKGQINHKTGMSQPEAEASYARFFDLYRREFNQEPPRDIWPGVRETRQRAFFAGMIFVGLVFVLFFGFGGSALARYAGDAVPFIGFLAGLVLFVLGIGMLSLTDLDKVARCG